MMTSADRTTWSRVLISHIIYTNSFVFVSVLFSMIGDVATGRPNVYKKRFRNPEEERLQLSLTCSAIWRKNLRLTTQWYICSAIWYNARAGRLSWSRQNTLLSTMETLGIHTHTHTHTHTHKNPHTHTYVWLTPLSLIFLQKLTVSRSVKNFVKFNENSKFIAAFTKDRYLSLSWAVSIQVTPSNLCLNHTSGPFIFP
jgi:hypothetical protein